jgi:hypothetical protein
VPWRAQVAPNAAAAIAPVGDHVGGPGTRTPGPIRSTRTAMTCPNQLQSLTLLRSARTPEHVRHRRGGICPGSQTAVEILRWRDPIGLFAPPSSAPVGCRWAHTVVDPHAGPPTPGCCRTPFARHAQCPSLPEPTLRQPAQLTYTVMTVIYVIPNFALRYATVTATERTWP